MVGKGIINFEEDGSMNQIYSCHDNICFLHEVNVVVSILYAQTQTD